MSKSKKRNGIRQIAQRSYWREADARSVIEGWRRSGETLTRFAKQHGIVRNRLARWSKRLEGTAPMVLHPVQLVEPVAGVDGAGAIEIQLAAGACIRVPQGFRSDELRRVLAVLTEAAPC